MGKNTISKQNYILGKKNYFNLILQEQTSLYLKKKWGILMSKLRITKINLKLELKLMLS